jgi:hypothetical protein
VCAALLADGRRAQLCAEAGLPHGLVKRDSFYSRPALPWAVEDRRGRRACAASSRLLERLARTPERSDAQCGLGLTTGGSAQRFFADHTGKDFGQGRCLVDDGQQRGTRGGEP